MAVVALPAAVMPDDFVVALPPAVVADDFAVVALPPAVVADGLAVVAAPATVLDGRVTESLDESDPQAASTSPPVATSVAILRVVLMCRCLPAPTPAVALGIC